MSANRLARARRRARAFGATLEALRAHYPESIGQPDRPLEIGVHRKLRDLHPEIARYRLRGAIALHVRQRPYVEALAAGAPRRALDGTPVEPVTEEQQAHAARRLAS